MRRNIAQALGVVVAVLVFAGVASAADSNVGTWKTNIAKSKFSPAPGPKSNTAMIEAWEDGIKVTTDGIDAEGKPTHTQYAVKYDGEDVPVTGNPNVDMISLKRIDEHTVQSTSKKDGKVTTIAKIVVSADGKTRTSTVTGTNPQGQEVNTTVVAEKQ